MAALANSKAISGTIAALGQDTSGVRKKVVEWSMAPHSLDVTGIQTRRGHLPSSKRLANTSDASLICAQISNAITKFSVEALPLDVLGSKIGGEGAFGQVLIVANRRRLMTWREIDPTDRIQDSRFPRWF